MRQRVYGQFVIDQRKRLYHLRRHKNHRSFQRDIRTDVARVCASTIFRMSTACQASRDSNACACASECTRC